MHYKSIKTITYRSNNSAGQPVPTIVVQGDFLKEFGFNVGDKINIKYKNNQIILDKIDYTNKSIESTR